MRTELEQVTYRQVATPPTATQYQLWEMLAPGTEHVFARAELFEGEVQWGVRLEDRAPGIESADLLRLVARLLVWHARCPAETVDVVLLRDGQHHPLVRVGGDYV